MGLKSRNRDVIRSCVLLLLPLAVLATSLRAESTPADPIRSKAPGDKDRNGKLIRPTEAADLTPANLNLQAGERLVYDIRVNGMPAGKTLLEVKPEEKYRDDKTVMPVTLVTRSNRAVSLFYDVHDKARTLIDVKGGFTRFFHIDRKEGDARSQEKINFTYDIGNMEAQYERPRSDGQWRTHLIPLTGKMLDPLSAIYYLRSMAQPQPKADAVKEDEPARIELKNLKVGESFLLPICTDRRVWNTRITVKERILAADFGDLKDRQCLVIEPEAEFKGLFERKGKMRIWVDIATGIPLKMTVEIPIGPAEVILSEHSNSPLDTFAPAAEAGQK
jgi:hypothetical protein